MALLCGTARALVDAPVALARQVDEAGSVRSEAPTSPACSSGGAGGGGSASSSSASSTSDTDHEADAEDSDDDDVDTGSKQTEVSGRRESSG